MSKFTITNSSLVISINENDILCLPTLYIACDTTKLYQNTPQIVLYNAFLGLNSTVFQGNLSDCTDSTGTTFTLSTFLTFASEYFGTFSNVFTPVPTTGGLTDAQLRATPVPITPRANSLGTGGTTPYKLISTASTNANNIKSSAGNLYSIIAIGLTSTVRYLKFYNKATAPTVGTDVPIMTIPVPANTQGAGVSIPFSMGVNFSLGISIAITSGSADNDTNPVGAGDVIVNFTYA